MNSAAWIQGLRSRFLGLPLVLLLVLVLGAFSGCRKPVEPDYFPIAVGATWEYAAETSKPVPGKESQIRTGKEICRCIGTEKLGGTEYFKVAVFFEGFPERNERIIWYRRAAEGVYRVDGSATNQEQFFLPLPLKPGTAWTNETSGGRTVGVMEGMETVDLPNRSYSNCVKVRIEQADQRGKNLVKTAIYFAPGVGGVKVEVEFGHIQFKLRLAKTSGLKAD